MKILFLTDIHEVGDQISQRVETFRRARPDLILIGGDFCLFTREEMDERSASFAQNLRKNEDTIAQIVQTL